MKKDTRQPSQARAVKTRDRILSAAFQSFLKNGYRMTSTVKIAKASGVSVGIVYSYFKDKDELFELWLNHLLQRCDDYFYNQFKLLEYNVEISMIVANILEKLTDMFFLSPLLHEQTNPYIQSLLQAFMEKGERLFLKCCTEANVFLQFPNESVHIIRNLLFDYSSDIKNTPSHLDREQLKSRYIVLISALFRV